MSNASVSDQLGQMIAEAADAKAAFNKDSKIGDSVSGTIEALSIRQVRDFNTNAPSFWDDGSPMLNVVVTLQTAEADNGDDTGLRTLYVKWWGVWRKAFAKAVVDGGAKEPVVGASLTATYTEDIPNPDPKLSATHVFSYDYTPAAAPADAAVTPEAVAPVYATPAQ